MVVSLSPPSHTTSRIWPARQQFRRGSSEPTPLSMPVCPPGGPAGREIPTPLRRVGVVVLCAHMVDRKPVLVIVFVLAVGKTPGPAGGFPPGPWRNHREGDVRLRWYARSGARSPAVLVAVADAHQPAALIVKTVLPGLAAGEGSGCCLKLPVRLYTLLLFVCLCSRTVRHPGDIPGHFTSARRRGDTSACVHGCPPAWRTVRRRRRGQHHPRGTRSGHPAPYHGPANQFRCRYVFSGLAVSL